MKRSFSFPIRYSEVDREGRLSPVALLQMMQSAADGNASSLSAGVADLHAEGLTWAMIRMEMHLEPLPGLGRTLTVDTWPSGSARSFVYRDYRLYDEQGHLLGQATSTWLVLSLETRRMVSIPGYMEALLPPPPGSVPLPRSEGRLPQPAGPDRRQFDHQVRWFDLDANGHAGNAQYLRWCLEALPPEVLRRPLAQATFTIRAEAHLDDVLTVTASPLPDRSWTHSIQRGEGLLAQALTQWG